MAYQSKEDNAVIHIDWNNSIPNKGIRRKDGYEKARLKAGGQKVPCSDGVRAFLQPESLTSTFDRPAVLSEGYLPNGAWGPTEESSLAEF
ncbi:hypothetical protein KSU89_08070 [Bifidobacterium longum]|uniref:hypothetical protein n=1 Tax=Bifidobacterium longum TaxID=216816 RepID=UPI001C38F6B4|nr:hypothetical protein [Bifidobacterium longum]MBV3120921.1 hypothetical protein [Bifidobacterium longum]